jgi:hypothetical protein
MNLHVSCGVRAFFLIITKHGTTALFTCTVQKGGQRTSPVLPPARDDGGREPAGKTSMRCRNCGKDIGASTACETNFYPRAPRPRRCLICMRRCATRGKKTMATPAAVAAPPSTAPLPQHVLAPDQPLTSAPAAPERIASPPAARSTPPPARTSPASHVPPPPSTQPRDASTRMRAPPAPSPGADAAAPSAARDSLRGNPASTSPALEAGMCRICHEDEAQPALIAPCACSGSSRLVHPSCLARWQRQGHIRECEVCHAPWR